MQTIGERLEEARKRKGISIREAAESTKIRGDYLQKFEANSFEIDLPPLYIRGFVRAYARFLELDSEKVSAEVASLIASDGRSPRRESREVYGRVELGDASVPAPEGGDARPPAASSIDQAVLLKYGLLGGGALVLVIILVVVANLLFSHTETAAPKATPKAPDPMVQVEQAQTLTVTATAPTRIKVVQDVDGKVLFNGSLAAGETRSLKKAGRLLITVESGASIRTEVNGRNYPVPIEGYGRYALD